MSAGYKHWSIDRLQATLDRIRGAQRDLSSTPKAHRGFEWEFRRYLLRKRRRRVQRALSLVASRAAKRAR